MGDLRASFTVLEGNVQGAARAMLITWTVTVALEVPAFPYCVKVLRALRTLWLVVQMPFTVGPRSARCALLRANTASHDGEVVVVIIDRTTLASPTLYQPSGHSTQPQSLQGSGEHTLLSFI